MSDDYKYDIQEMANEIAWEKYDKEFYDLDNDQQYEVYKEAEECYWDGLADQSDNYRDRIREEDVF